MRVGGAGGRAGCGECMHIGEGVDTEMFRLECPYSSLSAERPRVYERFLGNIHNLTERLAVRDKTTVEREVLKCFQ